MSQHSHLALSENTGLVVGDLGNFPTELLEQENLEKLASQAQEHVETGSTDIGYLPDTLVDIFRSAIDNLVRRVQDDCPNGFSYPTIRNAYVGLIPELILLQMEKVESVSKPIHPLIKDLSVMPESLGTDAEAIAINTMADNFFSNLVKIPQGIQLLDTLLNITERITPDELATLSTLEQNDPEGKTLPGRIASDAFGHLPLERLGASTLNDFLHKLTLLSTFITAATHRAQHCLLREIGEEEIAAAFTEVYGIENIEVIFNEHGSPSSNIKVKYESLDDTARKEARKRSPEFIAKLNDHLLPDSPFIISEESASHIYFFERHSSIKVIFERTPAIEKSAEVELVTA